MKRCAPEVAEKFRSASRMFVNLALVLAASFCPWLGSCPMLGASEGSSSAVESFDKRVPRSVEQLTEQRVAELAVVAAKLEQWAARRTWQLGSLKPQEVLGELERLVAAKKRVDDRRSDLWALRRDCAAVEDESARREVVRHYLRASSELIELAGRLRYSLHDAIETASFVLDPHPTEFREMIRLLTRQRVQIAASTLAYALLDPDEESGAVPFSDEVKSGVLELCRVSQDPQVVLFVAEFLRQPSVSAEPALAAMEAIRQLGLPQTPREEQTERTSDVPPPVTTAGELLEILDRLEPQFVSDAQLARRDVLRRWLAERHERGCTAEGYRWGDVEVRVGDWLLMRNPSPYNRFTDLGIGLFTHVGVVAEEVDERGVRRLVIVEVPERRARIPATNVDAYLQRTLHFVFLRHSDPQVAAAMGYTAASLIGNECRFDLTFRTERVAALKGQSLEGVPIHTYCAGLLLICADAAGRPRDEFFPIEERSAGAQFLGNLQRLGMSIGDGFISPTAPLFSSELRIVGEREPMYDPGREVKEAIYDHFADGMRFRELRPSPDVYQQLRESVASLAKTQPWLRRAIARAADVSEQLDLEAASRAAAVVETLDEIADAAALDFQRSRMAILMGPSEVLHEQGLPAEELKDLMALRREHAELLDDWLAGRLTPRALRRQLVDYYSRRGRQQLDHRFFP